MRKLFGIVDIALPIAGVMIILAAFLPEMKSQQVGAVVLGALLIQAGIMRVARHLLPDKRKFLALRAEVEMFLIMMRQLNTASLALKEEDTPENRREFRETAEAMRKAMERMTRTAGKVVEGIAGEVGEIDTVTLWKNDFFGAPDFSDKAKRQDSS